MIRSQIHLAGDRMMAIADGKRDPGGDGGSTRLDHVRAAIASARLAGVRVTPDTLGIMGDFSAGRIDGDEAVERVLGLYGPGAVPRT